MNDTLMLLEWHYKWHLKPSAEPSLRRLGKWEILTLHYDKNRQQFCDRIRPWFYSASLERRKSPYIFRWSYWMCAPKSGKNLEIWFDWYQHHTLTGTICCLPLTANSCVGDEVVSVSLYSRVLFSNSTRLNQIFTKYWFCFFQHKFLFWGLVFQEFLLRSLCLVNTGSHIIVSRHQITALNKERCSLVGKFY